MKIIALYLPQFHAIKENNEWWGSGFTEWDTTKKGKVLVDSQYQPRIPYNNNYYNLLDKDTIKWQIEIAKDFGVYGFCVYHYWFSGKLLLEKPMEIFLNNPDLDYPIFFCWANENWTNIWEGDTKSHKTLIANKYDDTEDWDNHFNYLLKFFRDQRYMKENGKPIMGIYDPQLIPYSQLKRMISRWQYLAKKNGFPGLTFFYQSSRSEIMMNNKQKRLFDFNFEYFPPLIEMQETSKLKITKMKITSLISRNIRKVIPKILDKNKIKNIRQEPFTFSYDITWEKILKKKPTNSGTIPGAFTDWDNTARRGTLGKVYLGSTPDKFEKYLKDQICRAKNVYNKDTIILFAWNEWSEGGYLEPDEKFNFKYLNAVKNALHETNEMPRHYTNYTNIFGNEEVYND